MTVKSIISNVGRHFTNGHIAVTYDCDVITSHMILRFADFSGWEGCFEEKQISMNFQNSYRQKDSASNSPTITADGASPTALARGSEEAAMEIPTAGPLPSKKKA